MTKFLLPLLAEGAELGFPHRIMPDIIFAADWCADQF